MSQAVSDAALPIWPVPGPAEAPHELCLSAACGSQIMLAEAPKSLQSRGHPSWVVLPTAWSDPSMVQTTLAEALELGSLQQDGHATSLVRLIDGRHATLGEGWSRGHRGWIVLPPAWSDSLPAEAMLAEVPEPGSAELGSPNSCLVRLMDGRHDTLGEGWSWGHRSWMVLPPAKSDSSMAEMTRWVRAAMAGQLGVGFLPSLICSTHLAKVSHM